MPEYDDSVFDFPQHINSITKHLAPENQTHDVKAASVKAQAAALNADRMAKTPADYAGPGVQLVNVDGVQTIVPRGPLGADVPGKVAHIVSDDELEAMGGTPERWPDCQYPGCKTGKGQGRYQIVSASGKPISINRHGQIEFGQASAVTEQHMTRNEIARAEAGMRAVAELSKIGVDASGADILRGGPASVAPGQLVAPSVLSVCLAHQTLPYAPSKPVQRFISGPYSGHFTATRRAHAVAARTREETSTFSVKQRDGKDAWFVRGDDAQPGYKGKLEEMA